jgi:hypothetical protein
MTNFYNEKNLIVFFKQFGLSRNIKQIEFEKNNWKIHSKFINNEFKIIDMDLEYKKLIFYPEWFQDDINKGANLIREMNIIMFRQCLSGLNNNYYIFLYISFNNWLWIIRFNIYISFYWYIKIQYIQYRWW